MTITSIGKWFRRHSKIWSFIFAILVSVLILVFKNSILKLQAYGYVGLFLLNILGSATIFLPTPLFLTAFAAATFLNPILVTIITSVGSAIGELTGYAAGYGAGDLIEKDAKIQKVKAWMDKYGLWTLFILGLVPNPFFDLAGIVAGATEIPIAKFLLVVWAGKLVKFGVIVFLGTNSVVLVNKFL